MYCSGGGLACTIGWGSIKRKKCLFGNGGLFMYIKRKKIPLLEMEV
jgi:hypothetical protein